jgi:hypothetical protein
MKTPVVFFALPPAATAALIGPRGGTPVRVCCIVSDLETGNNLWGEKR